MTAAPNAPIVASGVIASKHRERRLQLCNEVAAALNATAGHLRQVEATLGPDAAAAAELRLSFTELCGHVDRAMRLLTGDAIEEPPEGAGLDEERLDRLLEIAGPETAAELLHRLHLDLRLSGDRLARGLDLDDWAEVRAQTHVLVSLAGTVGAVELQRLCEALNAAAHRQAADAADALARELFGRLDALAAYVGRRADAR